MRDFRATGMSEQRKAKGTPPSNTVPSNDIPDGYVTSTGFWISPKELYTTRCQLAYFNFRQNNELKETVMIRKLLLACFLLASTTAHAVTVTAKVVADDFFKVFVGDVAGTSLTQVGGSGGTLWFSQGTPFSFDVTAGQYIYVAAWDSASYGPPHMWIGEFDVGGTTLLSNTADWLSKYDASIKDPSTTDVQTLAQSANPWTALAVSMPNGSAPYGSLIGGSAASMVWHDAFDGSSASENGYALFRAAAVSDGGPSAVPLPAALPLMLSGLGILGFASRRRKNAAV